MNSANFQKTEDFRWSKIEKMGGGYLCRISGTGSKFWVNFNGERIIQNFGNFQKMFGKH